MCDALIGVKYKLLMQFYGVEEYIEYAVDLIDQIELLSQQQDEFSQKKQLLNLDIWYSRFFDQPTDTEWNPFEEPFSHFNLRSRFIIAQYLPTKQYADGDILAFIR